MNDNVIFELSDDDLEQFQTVFRDAQGESGQFNRDEILEALDTLMQDVRSAKVPKFVVTRLSYLESLVEMISDDEWKLPQEDTDRILDALVYFADPNDLIPDKVPGLGYIDDAIKVELVRRELAPEIDAYDDFCAFRSAEEKNRRAAGKDASVSREDWLKSKREELQRDLHKKRGWFKPFSRNK